MRSLKHINIEKIPEKQLISVIIFIYLVTRIVNLTSIPMFNDEALWIDWGWKSLNTPNNLWLSLTDAKQPLFIWLLGLAQKLFSNPLVAGRLVSISFGLITTLCIYFVSKLIFEKKVALLASITYALIPIHLFYDRMAMMESAMSALGILTLYFLLLSLDSKKSKYPITLGIVLGIGLFTKTTAYIYALLVVVVFVFYIVKNHKDRELNIKNLLISISISQLILIPLYSQSMFWENLSTTDRYTLTFSELANFPFQTWFNNLIESVQMIFWHQTPLILLTGVVGLGYVFRKNNLYQKVTAFWLLAGVLFIIFVLKKSLPRYLVPSLPLLSLFSSYFFIWITGKKKLIGISLTIISLTIPMYFSFLLLSNPSNYFGVLNNFTVFSQKGIYMRGWTSGHGVNETVEYLKSQAKNSRVLVGVRLDAGNPESAMFAYFNNSKQVLPTYLDVHMFGDQLTQVECLESSVPLYFVSRDIQMAGLHKYFEEIERFYKPEGENFIGIHRLKTNCEGKTVKLL